MAHVTPVVPRPPATATLDAQLANLVAFTKLLGDLRYFHPSDEGANAAWEALAVAAVPRVEQARSADDLAAVLTSVFSPVAPTVRIYASGHRLPTPTDLSAPTGAEKPTFVGWVHHGVRLDDPQSIWSSVRVTNHATPHSLPSDLLQRVPTEIVRGKTLRLRASARAALASSDASASLVVFVERPANNQVIAAVPVTDSQWRDLTLSASLPDVDRMAVHIGLRVIGDGKAWLDDVSASLDGVAAPLALENHDFESTTIGEAPRGWFSSDEHATTSGLQPHRGSRCGQIDSPPLPVEALPLPEQTLHVSLGGGVEADVPLTLYVDAQGRTIPAASQRMAPPPVMRERQFRYSASDRAVRVADVALAWNVLQHFYPYFDDVHVDWARELRDAFARAVADPDAAAFHTTLKRLVTRLHDGHGLVMRSIEAPGGGEMDPPRASLPIAVRVVEHRLVVSAVAPSVSNLRVGDVVVAIDGVSTAGALAATGEMISAATQQWLEYREASVIVFGPKDEPVQLSFQRGPAAPFTTVLRRTEDYAPSSTRDRPDKIADVGSGVMYVDLERITDHDFETALPKLVAARGVVFDLRGYPKRASVLPLRHLSNQTLRCPPFFVPKAKRPDRDGAELEPAGRCALAPLAPRIAGKIVFLTDARAISYAETYLAIVEGHHLATIVGEPTAGTNGNSNEFVLPGGYRVRITGMKALKTDGSRHHGVGTLPTVPCAPTIAGVVAGTDEVLECGIAAALRGH